MWEASLGIIAMLVIMFSIAIFFSSSSAKPRARSRQEVAVTTGATGPTTLNTESDSKQLEAAQGVSLDRPSTTPTGGR